MPKYFVSAYREPGHPSGYVVHDFLPMPTLDAALAWVVENAFRPRRDVGPRFTCEIDKNGVVQMSAQYRGDWWAYQIEQLDGVDGVVIQRGDVARGAYAEEIHEGDRPMFPL